MAIADGNRALDAGHNFNLLSWTLCFEFLFETFFRCTQRSERGRLVRSTVDIANNLRYSERFIPSDPLRVRRPALRTCRKFPLFLFQPCPDGFRRTSQ